MGSPRVLSHESSIYHESASWYERIFGVYFQARIQSTLHSLTMPPGSRVLEVGVGTGFSLSAYPRHAEVTGVDLSSAMLAQAQGKIDHHGWRHIQLREMDALNLDYPDGHFDFVTAFHVVSVVPDHRALTREMVRVCKPGGTLVVINHFRSRRPWVALPMDRLDPLTRRLGWRTTLSLDDLIADMPLRLLRDEKTSWRSLFRVVTAAKIVAGEIETSPSYPQPRRRRHKKSSVPPKRDRASWTRTR